MSRNKHISLFVLHNRYLIIVLVFILKLVYQIKHLLRNESFSLDAFRVYHSDRIPHSFEFSRKWVTNSFVLSEHKLRRTLFALYRFLNKHVSTSVRWMCEQLFLRIKAFSWRWTFSSFSRHLRRSILGHLLLRHFVRRLERVRQFNWMFYLNC